MILPIVNAADLSRLVGGGRHLGGSVRHHAERYSSRLLGFWAMAAAGFPAAGSALELGLPFADNAVFQQQIHMPVWGASPPGAKITVTFGAQTKTATASQDGKWRVTLDPLPADKLASVNEAPAGNDLTVSAGAAGAMETKTVKKILIGEVWLCSGQSNIAIPNTGMSVAIDIGDPREHPPNKYDTGIRLARWALHRDYAKKDLVPSGPLYKSCKIEGDKIRVSFDYAQNGLMCARKDGLAPPVPTPGAAIPWLSIQAKDGTWHWAEGVIDGTDLLVSCKDVTEPVAVRYAYTNFPAGFNLYNKDGLPASPFSTCGF